MRDLLMFHVWHSFVAGVAFVARGPVTGTCSWLQKVAVPMGKVANDVSFVVCCVRIALARLREVGIKCKFRGRRGIL